MSKYTTEVRFICESKSGLEDSKGFNDIDTILDNSWDKIFTTQCTFFNEEYRKVICKKILKHYYTREIGAETVGLWQLWMNRRLEEIMPYYNQLYSSAELEFDPFEDIDYTTTHSGQSSGRSDRTMTEDATETGKETGTEDVSSKNGHNSNGVDRDLYSETPQGSIDDVETEHYLTNARKVTRDLSENSLDTVDRDTSRNTENVTDRDVTDNTTASSTDSYTDRVFGKRNGQSYSKMLEEFRSTMLNIDMQVIEEFADLFMGLW